ncbi:MAG: phage tail protein, partial [Anaerovoracaceae bacterium]
NEESREVQTETLTVKARPLASGYVKAKTGDTTTVAVYEGWYKTVYTPTATQVVPEQPAQASLMPAPQSGRMENPPKATKGETEK